MNDEITKQKYRILRNKIYQIRNKINNLMQIHDQTYSSLTDFILLDGKIIKEEKFNKLKQAEKNINNELNSIVIPKINNKL